MSQYNNIGNINIGNGVLKYVKIFDYACAPTKATPDSAGYDLSSIEEKEIQPNGTEIFRTGIKIALPLGTCGRISSRSGLGFNHSIVAFEGIIDQDYRGEIMIKLFNHGNSAYRVKIKDKIAQLICFDVRKPDVVCVRDLDETVRGERRFGSSSSVSVGGSFIYNPMMQTNYK